LGWNKNGFWLLCKRLEAERFAWPGAAEEFERWDRAGGVVVAALLRRRTVEHDTFLTA
jgi:GH24 family phage-related lysozyme (muramidase)